jgi:2-keto-3-deoxy-L-rhamnonate aldolase RhmA
MGEIMTLKEQLKAKKLSLGSWITIGHPTIAELMAKSGFDWLAIDMEHSPLTIGECQELIRTIDLCGVTPLVRVGANDPLLIKRAMDSGAHGVIVPMVNTSKEAEAAVASVYYPPKGRRGVGLGRAQGYGKDFNSYKDNLEKTAVVVVQIEHIEAVKNLDAILAVPGIDAIIVGPYDLSGSMGKPGNFTDPEMIEALKKIQTKTTAKGIAAGVHVVSSDVNQVNDKIAEGYSFIAYGVDFLFIQENCRKGLSAIKR